MLVWNSADQTDLFRFQAALANQFQHAVTGVRARPADVFNDGHNASHRKMIEELHEDDGIFAVLEKHIGLATAGPIGQPINIGCVPAGAVNQERIHSLLSHQIFNRLVSSRHLFIGERWII